MTTLTRQISSGAAWSLAARIAAQAVQFCTTAVLARLLAPEAYGLVGMVAAFSGFAGLFVEIGIGTALVQRREITDDQLDSAFALTILLGLAMTASMALLAPAVAAFYERPVLTTITRASALSFVLSAVAIVPRALLVRRMRIRAVALIDFAGGVATAGISLALAWAGAGVWALVGASLGATLATSMLFLAASRWRPRLARSFAPIRPLLAVSLNLLAFSALNYWARSIDNVLIGRVLGERELGLYMRAYALMVLPITQINAALATSLIAGLSRIQGDAERARTLYLRTLGLVAFISFPAMLGLSAVAGPFVTTVYGDGWSAVAPMLRILAVSGALQAIGNTVGWIYLSHGRTDLMFRWGVFGCSVIIAALAVGVWLGSGVWVSALYLLANAALLVPSLAYAGRIIGIRVADLGRVLVPTGIASVAMMFGVNVVDLLVPARIGAPVRLGIGVVVGVLMFAALTRALRLGPAGDIASLVSRSDRPVVAWLGRAVLLLTGRGAPGSSAQTQ